MGQIHLRVTDELLERIKKAAKKAEIPVTQFILEATKHRLKHLPNDHASVFKDDSHPSDESHEWAKMLMTPLVEILYYQRQKVDDKTKAAALKKAAAKTDEVADLIKKQRG